MEQIVNQVIKSVDLTNEELKSKIAELESQKQALQHQISTHRQHSEEVKISFTKTNLERLEKMEHSINNGMHELLNSMVEYIYLAGIYKKDLRLSSAGNWSVGSGSEILSLGDFLLQHEKPGHLQSK